MSLQPIKLKRPLPEDTDMETQVIIEAKEGFTFGCDPEGFIVDPDGKPVSAAGLLPGTKEEPFKVEGGAVQVDGMAAEFNIDAVSNFTDFNRNIKTVVKQLEGMLPEGHSLSFLPSVHFDFETYEAAPDEAKMLGCSPDFNAWTGDVNPPPSPEMIGDPFLRTGAGHLHVGWTEDADLGDVQHTLNCRDLVKQLDWYLGGWSVKADPDPTRRLLYGKAGAYRPKSYGVEYRVLSNFWVTSRDRRLAVWNRMQKAIADMRSGFMPDRVRKSYSDMLREAINTSQRNLLLEKECRFPINTIDASYARF